MFQESTMPFSTLVMLSSGLGGEVAVGGGRAGNGAGWLGLVVADVGFTAMEAAAEVPFNSSSFCLYCC